LCSLSGKRSPFFFQIASPLPVNSNNFLLPTLPLSAGLHLQRHVSIVAGFERSSARHSFEVFSLLPLPTFSSPWKGLWRVVFSRRPSQEVGTCVRQLPSVSPRGVDLRFQHGPTGLCSQTFPGGIAPPNGQSPFLPVSPFLVSGQLPIRSSSSAGGVPPHQAHGFRFFEAVPPLVHPLNVFGPRNSFVIHNKRPCIPPLFKTLCSSERACPGRSSCEDPSGPESFWHTPLLLRNYSFLTSFVVFKARGSPLTNHLVESGRQVAPPFFLRLGQPFSRSIAFIVCEVNSRKGPDSGITPTVSRGSFSWNSRRGRRLVRNRRVFSLVLSPFLSSISFVSRSVTLGMLYCYRIVFFFFLAVLAGSVSPTMSSSSHTPCLCTRKVEERGSPHPETDMGDASL